MLDWLFGSKTKTQTPPERPGAAGNGRVPKIGYQAPVEARSHLGKITDLLPYSRTLMTGREKEIYFARVPTQKRIGAAEFIYIHTSALDLDTDGNRKTWGKTDVELDRKTGKTTHNDQTSMGGGVDSNVTSYVVLPLSKGSWICNDLVNMGDVAVIIGKGRVVYAMLAESGPPEKLGEASIQAHRLFGHEVMGGERVVNGDISGNFVTLIFPGSGKGRILTADEMKSLALPLFRKLGGRV